MSNQVNTDVLKEIREIVELKQADKYPALIDFLNSNSFEVIDTAALAIHDVCYVEGLKKLIDRAADKETENHNATLLYACSAFDCTEHIDSLIDILITSDYHASIEAFSLLRDNCRFVSSKSIKDNIKLIELKKEQWQDSDNEEVIEEFLAYLSELAVTDA